MIIWDQYTDKLSQNQKITTKEEEIDITSAFGGNEPSTIEIEEPTQEPRTQQQKQSITKTPFPWTVDKFCAEVEKLVLGEECEEYLSPPKLVRKDKKGSDK